VFFSHSRPAPSKLLLPLSPRPTLFPLAPWVFDLLSRLPLPRESFEAKLSFHDAPADLSFSLLFFQFCPSLCCRSVLSRHCFQQPPWRTVGFERRVNFVSSSSFSILFQTPLTLSSSVLPFRSVQAAAAAQSQAAIVSQVAQSSVAAVSRASVSTLSIASTM